MAPVSGVVETAPVASVHAFGSADPADFPVPGGREEEWRFTPLRRLRGLHTDTALPPAKVKNREAPVEIYRVLEALETT